jgi:hypothetical protein
MLFSLVRNPIRVHGIRGMPFSMLSILGLRSQLVCESFHRIGYGIVRQALQPGYQFSFQNGLAFGV